MATKENDVPDEVIVSDPRLLRLAGYICGQNPGKVFDTPCCSKTTPVYRIVPKVEQAVEGRVPMTEGEVLVEVERRYQKWQG